MSDYDSENDAKILTAADQINKDPGRLEAAKLAAAELARKQVSVTRRLLGVAKQLYPSMSKEDD